LRISKQFLGIDIGQNTSTKGILVKGFDIIRINAYFLGKLLNKKISMYGRKLVHRHP
jgi:hypothetical protein